MSASAGYRFGYQFCPARAGGGGGVGGGARVDIDDGLRVGEFGLKHCIS